MLSRSLSFADTNPEIFAQAEEIIHKDYLSIGMTNAVLHRNALANVIRRSGDATFQPVCFRFSSGRTKLCLSRCRRGTQWLIKPKVTTKRSKLFVVPSRNTGAFSRTPLKVFFKQ